MSQLTVQEVDKNNPVTPTFNAAASGGDSFLNNGRVVVYFKNADGAATRTITFDSLVDCNQGFDHDIEVEVPISGEKMVGFFETNRFNDTSGLINMTYDDESDLTVAVVKIK